MTSRAVLTRRPVVSWALYDWANSAFATTVMAGFFPVFFKQHWNAGVIATESTFRLGVTSGLASLIIAVMAPVLGAIADRSSSPRAVAAHVHGARCGGHRRPRAGGPGPLGRRGRALCRGVLRFLGRHRLQRLVAAARRRARRVRPGVWLRLRHGLPRGRPAVRPERVHDTAAGDVRAARRGGSGARLLRHDGGVVARVRVTAACCS